MSEERDRAQFKAWLHPRSSTSFHAQAAHFRFSPIPDMPLCRTDPDARRGAAVTVNFAKLPQLLRKAV
jgi:hypothetical protein